MSIYTEVKNESGYKYILRDNEDGTFSSIPIDPSNSDYQAYLAHLTESLPTSKP